MLNKIIHILPSHRRRFRHMTFDELSELYASQMLRALAISMAGIFIPVYLYENGLELWQIFVFYAISFAMQSIMSLPFGKIIARFGPKHSILISFFISTLNMLGLVFIDSLPSVFILAFVIGLGNLLYYIAFHVDFSKVKKVKKEGNELGWVFILGRTGATLGPILGGTIAYLVDSRYVFVFAIVVLFSGSLPLFLTSEPTKIRQKFEIRLINVRKMWRDIASYSSMTVTTTTSIIIWPLFLAVVVFNENPYIQIGSITTLATVVSIFSAKTIGKLVDNKKGRLLLRYHVVFWAILNMLRPFVSSFTMAASVNVANDAANPGYKMPLLKGMFDAGDDHPGARIAYFSIQEVFACGLRSFVFIIGSLMAYLITSDRLVFFIIFLVGSLIALGVMLEKYPALNQRRKLL